MIDIVDRYFFKEFIKYFIGSLTLLTGVAIISKTMERLPVLLNYEGPFINIILYLVYHIPYFITIVGAPSLMFAVAFNISMFAKNKELVVVIAAGRSFKRIITPILTFSFLFSLFFFVLSEYVSYPLFVQAAIDYEYIKGNEKFELYGNRNNYHVKVNDHFFHAGRYTANDNLITHFHLMESRNKIIRKIYESDFAIVQKGRWILLQGSLTTFDKNGKYLNTARFPYKFLPLKEGPEMMRILRRNLEEMNYIDILEVIAQKIKKNEGYREYEVELNWHYSFPFICFVVVFIAGALGAHVKKGAMSASIGIATVATLGYYIIMFIGKSLAITGILHPIIGAWLANIVFTIISLFILYKFK